MTISYEWEITEILTDTVDGNENAIVEVSWKRVGSEGDITCYVSGKCTLETGETFINFSDVTLENVTSWVEASMDEVEHNLLEEQVQIAIQTIKDTQEVVEDTKVVASFPWASDPE